jgi:hypothetical protein
MKLLSAAVLVAAVYLAWVIDSLDLPGQQIHSEPEPPVSYTEAMSRLDVANQATAAFIEACPVHDSKASWAAISARLKANIAVEMAWDDGLQFTNPLASALVDEQDRLNTQRQVLEARCRLMQIARQISQIE